MLSTLDARGEYALIAYRPDEQAAPRIAISRWRARSRCDVPVWGEPVAAPLPRAFGDSRSPAVYVPVAVAGDEGPELMLIDPSCKLYGPFGQIEPDTARTAISPRDGRGYLLFRDARSTLWLLDPALGLEPRALAHGVEAVRASAEPDGKRRDVLWIAADGELTRRTLAGELLARVGSDVHNFMLAPNGMRVAFRDGSDLYEAVAPRFRANLLAEDGCRPRYGGGTLDFFAPCAPQALRRVALRSGRYQEFEPGVFASDEQEGVQLDYSRSDDGEVLLHAQYESGARVPVEPPLAEDHAYVLDEQRIAGLDDAGRFGIWQRGSRSFAPLLEGVAEVVPYHSGKKHRYAWLIHHDVQDELGTLTLLHDDGERTEVARSVPLPAQRGYIVEGGGTLTVYPYAAPVVVLLADAQPAEDLPQRFCGRLRALSITGEPRADLADDVCSYVVVAAPVPGVLFGVERGAQRGLWFVAL